MSSWIRTMLKALAVASLPMAAMAGTPPTVFKQDDLAHLIQLSQSLATQTPTLDQARKIALALVKVAGDREDGTLDQIHADQALVLKLAEITAGDPEILAVHANLLGVEASIQEDLITVLTLAKASSRALDKLARDNPDNGGVLMQRGLNAFHSPKIAGRINIAIADFETLSKGPYGLLPDELAETRLLLAQSYIKANRPADAEAILSEIAAAGVTRWADEAKTILAAM